MQWSTSTSPRHTTLRGARVQSFITEVISSSSRDLPRLFWNLPKFTKLSHYIFHVFSKIQTNKSDFWAYFIFLYVFFYLHDGCQLRWNVSYQESGIFHWKGTQRVVEIPIPGTERFLVTSSGAMPLQWPVRWCSKHITLSNWLECRKHWKHWVTHLAEDGGGRNGCKPSLPWDGNTVRNYARESDGSRSDPVGWTSPTSLPSPGFHS